MSTKILKALHKVIASKANEGLVQDILNSLKLGKLSDSLQTMIRQTMDREGFSRKTLKTTTLKKGEPGRIRIKTKDGLSSASQVRNKYVSPAEINISGRVAIEDIDAEQDPQLLEDAVHDILEATLVAEDRLWKKSVDASVPTTPFTSFADLTSKLKAQGVPPGMWLFGSSVWAKLQTDSSLDPVSKKQIVDTGKLTRYLGIPIHTDSHRDSNLKVLDANDLYLVGKPEYVGVIQERKPLSIEHGDLHNVGRAEQVLAYSLIESLTIANPKGIVRSKV